MEGPLVSVIMPVYNAGPYVGESIRSILSQTYDHLELVIVDDGSTDESASVIASFSDPRIVVVSQPNQGVSAALNTALARVRGTLVARQDADDISDPERLQRQVEWFNARPKAAILGTWGRFINGGDLPESVLERPVSDAAIRFALLFDSPFVSTSVMFRKALIDRSGGFDNSRKVWDDYDMWSRLVPLGTAGNLPLRLVQYRLVGSGLTQTNKAAPQWVMEQRRRNILRAIPDLPPDLVEPFAANGREEVAIGQRAFRRIRQHLLGYVRSLTHDPAERAALMPEVRSKLMAWRVIQHRTFLHRVADHVWKRVQLP